MREDSPKKGPGLRQIKKDQQQHTLIIIKKGSTRSPFGKKRKNTPRSRPSTRIEKPLVIQEKGTILTISRGTATGTDSFGKGKTIGFIRGGRQMPSPEAEVGGPFFDSARLGMGTRA